MPELIQSNQTTIIFLRHGESVGNAEKRHQGQAEFPLTEAGIQQVRLLGTLWESRQLKFDLVLASPLARAKQTAEILSQFLDFDLILDPIWMERDNGKLAGLRHDRALEVIPPPDFISLYDPIADTGESQWELYLRAGAALNTLMVKPPGRYLVISHGALLSMVMKALVGVIPQNNFQGPNFHFSNTGYSLVSYQPENGSWNILKHNQTSHLSPAESLWDDL